MAAEVAIHEPGVTVARGPLRATYMRTKVSCRGNSPPHSEKKEGEIVQQWGNGKEEQMATLDEIGQEKQRISERLARLDAERTKLGDQPNELEIAERILTRFGGKADTTERRRRGRSTRTAPAAGKSAAPRSGQQAPTVSLSDAILKAVQAHAEGAAANDVLSYLAQEFGMLVRPNHLGIALQRHRRAGRLENRDQRWYLRLDGAGAG
jgi:hypothetical protein